jgi:hypothetical protein
VTEAKPREAFSRLVDLKRAKLPADAVAQIDGERIRILLVQRQVGEALRLSRELSSDRAPAELQLARLEALVADYVREANQAADSEIENQIVALVNEIGSVHGSSWRRRAELVATPAAYQSSKLAEAASPELVALRSIREGKIDDAISAYERAAMKARQDKSLDRLFAATLAAARLEAKEGRLDAASMRCRRIAVENPMHDRAATTHLWAIEYARRRLTAEESGPSNSRVDLHKVLAEHIENWPGETADAVRELQKRLVE